MRKHKKIYKLMATFVALNMLVDVCFPTALMAISGGPGSPEFSSFEPVGATDLVNLFDGSLTYNLPVLEIPGPDGGGYAMSLSYHSGASSETEASWVGHGWTLNPGAVNRGVSGLPDEYKRASVMYYNKTRPNWTVSAKKNLGMEIFSATPVLFNFGRSIRFNNYQGYSSKWMIGADYHAVGLGVSFDGKGVTYKPRIHPQYIKDLYKVEAVKVIKEADYITQRPHYKLKKSLKKYVNKTLQKTATKNTKAFLFNQFTSHPMTSSYSPHGGFGFTKIKGITINPGPIPLGVQIGRTLGFTASFTSELETKAAYGYAHSQNVMEDNAVGDFYVERDGTFDGLDKVMGTPFSSPDNFTLTGAGLMGGFRMRRLKNGHYFPNSGTSEITNFVLGAELSVGGGVGGGITFGAHKSKSEMRNWPGRHIGHDVKPQHHFDTDAKPVFRFLGDQAGTYDMTTSDLESARVVSLGGVAKLYYPDSVNDLYLSTESSEEEARKKVRRSSLIKPTYQQDIDGNKLETFEVVKENGQKYVYGGENATLFSTNEAMISVDVQNEPSKGLVYQPLYLQNNDKDFAGYRMDYSKHDVVLGNIKNESYSNTYMIKSIVTPDYIDLGAEGIDAADLGGWTKFSYYKKYGGDNHENWYRWRSPYTGLRYSKGTISGDKDDLASVATGLKEVAYLKKIETKTHVAYFVTNKTTIDRFTGEGGIEDSHVAALTPYLEGSQDDRLDGLSAADVDGTKDPAAEDIYAKGDKRTEKLEKIVLFSKSRMDKPVRTTYFKYDYSLAPNLPNNEYGGYPGNPRTEEGEGVLSGKLTLKKVWTEAEGVVKARISPYRFTYEYKRHQDYAKDVIDRFKNKDYDTDDQSDIDSYDSVEDFFFLNKDVYQLDQQNPSYDPELLDAWGNISYFGSTRSKRDQKWRWQGKQLPKRFDPGAWQLKQIKLPSGSEILIQYEEHEYASVQDRVPTTLVSLTSFDEDDDAKYSKFPEYTINLEDIGLDPDDVAEVRSYRNFLHQYFITDQRKIFFKFLYAMNGQRANLNQCNSEYITGYSEVRDIVYEESSSPKRFRFKLAGTVPREGCYQFYINKRNGTCYDNPGRDLDDYISDMVNNRESDDYDRKQFIIDLAKSAVAIKGLQNTIAAKYNSKELKGELRRGMLCATMDKYLSYLKVPVPEYKRGGGCRVKRLMMYDRGIDRGEASLYGTDYTYTYRDGKSSGVATNEPMSVRDDHTLVEFMAKNKQKWYDRMLVGRNKSQGEGPVGESLLPYPSVGYAQVVESSLHDGATGGGLTVHDFNTVKDYPYDGLYDYSKETESGRRFSFGGQKPEKGVEYTDLASNKVRRRLVIPMGVFNYDADKIWAAQGFRFVLNQMHGTPVRVASYTSEGRNMHEVPFRGLLTSSKSFEYFEPGEMVQTLTVEDGEKVVKWTCPGRESEMIMEKQYYKENEMGFQLEIDLTVGIAAILPPPIFPSGFPNITVGQKLIGRHLTTKILSYPTIQKKVSVYQDGITQVMENVAFNEETGAPMLTKTYDAYHGIELEDGGKHDGSIYSLNLPAWWYYPEMGSKVDNSNNSHQLSEDVYTVTSYGRGGNPILDDDKWRIPSSSVLSASAMTYEKIDKWFGTSPWSEFAGSAVDGAKVQEAGAYIFKPEHTYMYNSDITEAGNGGKKIFEGGMMNHVEEFDFTSEPDEHSKWLRTGTSTMYNKNGLVVEEKDAEGIYSAIKLGYNNTMPVMSAKNAGYDDLYFNGFEESGESFSKAHSGEKCMTLNSGEYLAPYGSLKFTDRTREQGAKLWFWMYAPNENQIPTQLNVKVSSGNLVPAKILSRVGEWHLVHAQIPASEFESRSGKYGVSIQFSGSNMKVDDVRFQPMNSEASCSVYHPGSFKLAAAFDSQHYGVFFQYDDEGRLSRKFIETERGRRMVQESHVNLVTQKRND